MITLIILTVISRDSCGIDLGKMYVVIGGQGAERKVTRYKTFGFDRVLPDLTQGRYSHACAKFENGEGKKVSVILLNLRFKGFISGVHRDWRMD